MPPAKRYHVGGHDSEPEQKSGRTAAPTPQAALATREVGIRISSDCSGWCSEVQAAQQVSVVPVRHVFASDVAPAVRRLIQHAFKPEQLYTDLRARPLAQEHIDIYTCGFPCQSFSKAGLQTGVADPRGQLIAEVVNFIQACCPASFLLENVPHLVTGFPEVFHALMETLQSIRGGAYDVQWDLRATHVHGGLPQHRTRVYIVGIRRDALKRPFIWPLAIRSLKLGDILSDTCGGVSDFGLLPGTAKKNVEKMLQVVLQQGRLLAADVILDCGGSKPQWKVGMCPCITATRGQSRDYWSARRGRRLTITELMKLQGANEAMLHGWENVISPHQMGHIVGNAMTVPIVAGIIRNIMISMCLPVRDI